MAELIYLFTALASLLVLIWAVLVLLILRAWQRQLDYTARRRGRNLPPPDLLPMPPATGAQRIYRGGMWREKGSDVWHPIGVPWEEGHTQRGNGSGGPSTPKPPIKPQPSAPPPLVGHSGWFINNPVQIAECGGPCTSGPSHCDCGALWLDLPSAKAIADKSWAEARRATFINPSLGVPWEDFLP